MNQTATPPAEKNRIGLSYLLSVGFHGLLVLGSALMMNVISSNPPAGTSYVTVNLPYQGEAFQEQNPTQETIQQEETVTGESEDPAETGGESGQNTQTTATPQSSFASSMSGADTSALQQVYTESTLNVRIRFPMGWTYQDNNVKSKLDAVTFIGGTQNPAYTPYVILEVKKKHLFYPSRYKYSMAVPNGNYTAYFGDPKEMEGQVSFIVYMRTETDEDYSLTLRINGMKNFLDYKPVFFSMLKSFKFGRNLF
ncbi:MAG: hypothetical protein IT279_15025 [Ignavibacteriaceae bacterium]|nr:hypothetical protein [Ignavibacteriaceae bacterium]